MLLGVTYCEFDNTIGPQLRYEYPPDVLGTEAFERLSDFVIVGKHLTNKVIVVKTEENYQYANYSVSIENAKYERNALLFALGLLLEKGTDPEPYESILRKTCQTLIALEIEREFLFQPESKSQLPTFLKTLYEELTDQSGEAFLRFDEANAINLKPFRIPREPPQIDGDRDVPMLLQDGYALSNLPWDLSLHHLIPYIDGIRTASQIAILAGMDIGFVKKSLRVLHYYNCILLTDVFKFSNTYHVLIVLDHAKDAILLLQSAIFSHAVSEDDKSSSEGVTSACGTIWRSYAWYDRIGETVQTIVAFLMSLSPGLSLKEVLLGPCFHLDFKGIDISRLLAIAQHRKIISRSIA